MGKFMSNILKKFELYFFILAVFVSLIVRITFPSIYHYFDVHAFLEWSPFFNPIKDVYLTSCYCNYPILGMMLSTGLIQLLNDSIPNFLVFLSFIDGVNVFLCYLILRKLSVPYPFLWSSLIGLLFSSWVGGALWGQIDNIGQLFILLILYTLTFLLNNRTIQLHRYGSLILLGGLFSACVLTKQLLVFPIFPIYVFLFFYLMSTLTWTRFLFQLFTLIVFSLLPVIFFDLWLNVPSQYVFSHIERIVDTGSEHINFISGNGFNLWMLFFSDQNQSSTNAFLMNFSPKQIGLALFGCFSILVIIYLFFFIEKFKAELRVLVLGLFGVIAFYNLMFNLVLTGTHERYLYHFYPFLIMFLVGIRYERPHFFKHFKFDLLFSIIGATLYGLFVFSILRKYLDTYFFHRFMMVFHLLLMLRLIYHLFKFASSFPSRFITKEDVK